MDAETRAAHLTLAGLPNTRYVDGLGWYQWTGVRWSREGAENALYREIIRRVEAAHALTRTAASARLCEYRALEGIAKICARLSGVPASTLDSHPDYLHAAGTTWHLATGQAWPTDSAELNTKAVDFDPADECPAWDAFLHSCFPGEPEMVAYLQRLVGYGITGYTNEQVFVLMQGRGANGKSTFINALSHALKDYCLHLPVQVLMNASAKDGESPSPMLVEVRGARMVFTSESERGGRLNESSVKLLTGGDLITAREMYKKPITFKPQALIWMATNHLPEIRGTDDGIWRRIKLVEWRESFSGDRVDKDIEKKLRAEAPGIVNWAIEGALEWHKRGQQLDEPERVSRTTKKYRSDSDFVGAFVPEWLAPDTSTWLPRSEIAAAWKTFCEANGQEDVKSMGTVYRALEEHGAESAVRNGVRGYRVRRVR
jgi:putative DNA primase/helicase